MADKKKAVVLTSPAGVAVFPALTEPDTKFNKDGEYTVRISLDPTEETTQPFLDKLEALARAALEEMKAETPKAAKTMQLGLPFSDETDKDGNETGRILVGTFKLKALVKPGEKSKKQFTPFTQKPKLYDAKGTPLVGTVKIGGGSVVKVAFTTSPYFVASSKTAGISLRLEAVQVIELKTWGESRSAGDFGFGEEEGYVADTFENVGETVGATTGEDVGGSDF